MTKVTRAAMATLVKMANGTLDPERSLLHAWDQLDELHEKKLITNVGTLTEEGLEFLRSGEVDDGPEGESEAAN